MNIFHRNITAIGLLILICLCFFYKIFIGQVPFPGDLLANIEPYKSQSLLGYAPGGVPNKAQGPDVLYQIYPWKYFVISEFKQGRLPFWNPHNFSGNLMAQNFQSAAFYPLNILYFLFDFNTAWSLFILSQPLLASILMFLFLRDIGRSRESSVLTSIIFAFSSYMTVWMEYGNIGSVLVWLPAILLLVRKILRTNKLLDICLGVICLVMATFGGYIQGLFYIYVILLAYVIFMISVEKKKVSKQEILSLFIVFIVPILLSSIQWLPTFDFFIHSTRSPYSLTQIEHLLNPIYYWVTIAVPDFFGHPASRNYYLSITYIERVMYFSVPFILMVFVASTYVKDNVMRFFFYFGIFSLLIGTNLPFVKYLYLIPIPMISTTVPTRVFSIFIFCMLVTGAFGIDFLIKNKKNISIRIIGAFIGIYGLLWLGLFILPHLMHVDPASISISKHNMIIPTALALVTVGLVYMRKINYKIFYWGLMILILCDLWIGFNKMTPFSPRELIYPSTPVTRFLQTNAGINRFWGYGEAYIYPNLQSIDMTYSPEGNDPLHLFDYGILLASSKDGKYPLAVPRLDANIEPGYGDSDLKKNQARQRILNLLGVEYVLNKKISNNDQPDTVTFDTNIYKLIWHNTPWQVYQNTEALPRFFLANDYIVINNSKDILKKIYSNIDLSKTLILSQKPTLSIDPNANGSAELFTYNPTEIIFRTKSTGNTLLFLSDNIDSSWRAYVDGKEVPLLNADMTFRSIAVPVGTHTIKMLYSPRVFIVGLTILSIGFAVLLFYSLYRYLYAKKI